MMTDSVELTPEASAKLLKYLEYPDEWSVAGLYPEEVARLQLAEVLSDLGLTREEFLSLPPDRVRESGSEHFRTAAISYWLGRSRTPAIAAALKAALLRDPHGPMARSFLRELENQG
jgi:hypothetical protein